MPYSAITSTADPLDGRGSQPQASATRAAESVPTAGVWASSLPVGARDALFRELSLPVGRTLVRAYDDGGHLVMLNVADVRVIEARDGWYVLETADASGASMGPAIGSRIFAKMNKCYQGVRGYLRLAEAAAGGPPA